MEGVTRAERLGRRLGRLARPGWALLAGVLADAGAAGMARLPRPGLARGMARGLAPRRRWRRLSVARGGQAAMAVPVAHAETAAVARVRAPRVAVPAARRGFVPGLSVAPRVLRLGEARKVDEIAVRNDGFARLAPVSPAAMRWPAGAPVSGSRRAGLAAPGFVASGLAVPGGAAGLPAVPVARPALPAMAPIGGRAARLAGGALLEAAPWPGAADAAAPAGPAGGGRDGGGRDDGGRPNQGDVFLDGMRVGRWMARELTRQAGGPQAGFTGFDPRISPAWPGALQGGAWQGGAA